MILHGESIYLRPFDARDAEELLELEVKNRDFFKLYAGTREEDFYTLHRQEQLIDEYQELAKKDQYYMFGVFLKQKGTLIGTIFLSEVLRGSLQGCFIGYFLDKSHNGNGYMTEAVKLLVRFAFEGLKLHRIEAGVMPHNLGSIKVLEKSGFHKEGIARKNVHINGRWEDHQVLAILNPVDLEEENCTQASISMGPPRLINEG